MHHKLLCSDSVAHSSCVIIPHRMTHKRAAAFHLLGGGWYRKKNPSSAHLCQKGNNQLRLPVVCVSAQLLLIKATLSSSDPSPYSKFRHRRSLIVDLMISHCYNDDHRCDDDDRTGRARQCKKNMNQLIFVIFWFGFACGCDFCQFSFRFAFLQYHAKCVCVISELHITYTHVWIR